MSIRRGFVVCLAALILGSATHASETPQKNGSGGPFHLVFRRPSKIGDRIEVVGTSTVSDTVRSAAAGLSLGNVDNYVDARYDAVEKVTQISDNGTPQTYRVFFRSFKTRNDNTSSYDDATCAGVAMDVTVWPDVKIEREDGEEIPKDEMSVLEEMFQKEDPDDTHADDVLKPGHDVNIGDVWKPSSGSLAKLFQSDGMIMPDNGVTASIKVAGRQSVHGVDCIILDLAVSCPNIDGDTDLPDNIKSVHGRLDESQRVFVPIDPHADIAGVNAKESFKYRAVVDDADGQPIELNGEHQELHSETVVKHL